MQDRVNNEASLAKSNSLPTAHIEKAILPCTPIERHHCRSLREARRMRKQRSCHRWAVARRKAAEQPVGPVVDAIPSPCHLVYLIQI
jgi:hypothetical protein